MKSQSIVPRLLVRGFLALLISGRMLSTQALADGSKPPTPAECLMAGVNFDPSNQAAVHLVRVCNPGHADENISHLSSLFLQRLSSSTTLASADQDPIGYLVNGKLLDVNAFRSEYANSGPFAPVAVAVTRNNFAQMVNLQITANTNRVNAVNAFNTSTAADIAVQNQATVVAKQKSGFCSYSTNSISAANGLVQLAQNAATYTRTWLGILSIFAPIVFSKCEVTVPPTKPVPTLSASSVDVGKTIVLTVTETGYSGGYAVTASAPNIVKIIPHVLTPDEEAAINAAKQAGETAPQLPDNTKKFDITGEASAESVTLTVTDDNGLSSNIALTVN